MKRIFHAFLAMLPLFFCAACGAAAHPGSSDPDHIQENTELYHFAPTEEEMNRICALDRNEKHDWY